MCSWERAWPIPSRWNRSRWNTHPVWCYSSHCWEKSTSSCCRIDLRPFLRWVLVVGQHRPHSRPDCFRSASGGSNTVINSSERNRSISDDYYSRFSTSCWQLCRFLLNFDRFGINHHWNPAMRLSISYLQNILEGICFCYRSRMKTASRFYLKFSNSKWSYKLYRLSRLRSFTNHLLLYSK